MPCNSFVSSKILSCGSSCRRPFSGCCGRSTVDAVIIIQSCHGRILVDVHMVDFIVDYGLVRIIILLLFCFCSVYCKSPKNTIGASTIELPAMSLDVNESSAISNGNMLRCPQRECRSSHPEVFNRRCCAERHSCRIFADILHYTWYAGGSGQLFG